MKFAVLGVDLGSKRIGIAICEAPGLPAVPLTTILHHSRARDIEAIIGLAHERNARTIVVGNPLRLDGTIGPASEKAGAFIRDLQAQFDGEVVAADERLTTAAAARKLQDLPSSGSTRRRYVDQLAAVEILNSCISREGAS
jgi:putative Holliday junction resolvase